MTTAPFSISMIPTLSRAVKAGNFFLRLHRFVPKTALQLYSCKRSAQMRGLHKMRRKNMYNTYYERPMTQIEKCEHLARMKLENPIEKAQREHDERVYRFSSIDEAIGVLSVVRRAW